MGLVVQECSPIFRCNHRVTTLKFGGGCDLIRVLMIDVNGRYLQQNELWIFHFSSNIENTFEVGKVEMMQKERKTEYWKTRPLMLQQAAYYVRQWPRHDNFQYLAQLLLSCTLFYTKKNSKKHWKNNKTIESPKTCDCSMIEFWRIFFKLKFEEFFEILAIRNTHFYLIRLFNAHRPVILKFEKKTSSIEMSKFKCISQLTELHD